MVGSSVSIFQKVLVVFDTAFEGEHSFFELLEVNEAQHDFEALLVVLFEHAMVVLEVIVELLYQGLRELRLEGCLDDLLQYMYIVPMYLGILKFVLLCVLKCLVVGSDELRLSR